MLLSIFGLIMAFATVFLIHKDIEIILWIPVMMVCGYTIARHCFASYFLHGFLVGILSSLIIVSIHLIFWTQWLDFYVKMRKYAINPMIHNHPRLSMALMGLGVGILSGTIIGLLSLYLSKRVINTCKVDKIKS